MPTFEAPGPGSWTQDSTHFPRPMTAYGAAAFCEGFIAGFTEGTARYGVLLSHLQFVPVNGFMYQQGVPVDAEADGGAEIARRMEAARDAFESRLWRADLRRWDDEVKPDSIRRNETLQAVPVRDLDTVALSRHLEQVRRNAVEMVRRHHIFSIPSIIATGHYVASAREWTGLDSGAILDPLRGSSPVSCGAVEELAGLREAIADAGLDLGGLRASSSAGDVLDRLRREGRGVGEALERYLGKVGMRLASGLDVADPVCLELPDMLLRAIATPVSRSRDLDAGPATARVRDAVPAGARDAFDALLAEARAVNRLRDERGVFNDLWGFGLARWALLEAGRRLSERGLIDEAESAVDLTHEETLALLSGEAGPSRAEVAERTDWRRNAPAGVAPPTLGPPPPPPPPLDGLPEHAALVMRAIGTALEEMYADPEDAGGSTVTGRAVSKGAYVGTARVVAGPAEFGRLRDGDVLVTTSTMASFNVVLPLLGAIVTDRGGQLSHAAIVAREYGIPAVVGTRSATRDIPDGARVRVDGSEGVVEIL